MPATNIPAISHRLAPLHSARARPSPVERALSSTPSLVGNAARVQPCSDLALLLVGLSPRNPHPTHFTAALILISFGCLIEVTFTTQNLLVKQD
jgi:hypothetical protein